MPWKGLGRSRDPDASPGTWLPNADLWVGAATALAAAAIITSILVSGKHGRASAAPSPTAPAARAAAVPASSSPPTSAARPSTSVARPTTTVAVHPVAPATTAAPPHLTQASGPDPVLVAALPSPADLGPGWAAAAPAAAAGSLATGAQCPTEPVPVADGGASLAATLDDGAQQAWVTVTLYRVGTPAAVAQERAFTSSSNAVSCLDAFAARDSVRYPWLGEFDGPQSVTSAPQLSLRQPGDAELLTVAADVNGAPRSAYWAFVHEYVGRYEALTVVSWASNAPLPAAGVQHIVDAVGASLARVAASSP